MTDRFHTVELSDPAFERDGLRLATVKSRALGRRADLSLWIPNTPSIGTLIILLHGVYGSHWVWSLKGGAHRTAQQLLDHGEIHPMVLAMPSDALSRDGTAYLTWPEAEDVEQWDYRGSSYACSPRRASLAIRREDRHRGTLHGRLRRAAPGCKVRDALLRHRCTLRYYGD